MITDLAGATISLYLSSILRPVFNHLWIIKKVSPEAKIPLIFYVLMPVFWVISLQHFGLYDGRRRVSILEEIKKIISVSLLAGVFLSGLLYLSYRDLSRFQFLLFIILGSSLMILWRVLYWNFISLARNKENSIRVLILGNQNLRTYLQNHHFTQKSISFIHPPPKYTEAELTKHTPHQDFLDLTGFIQSEKIDEIVIALKTGNREFINALISVLHTQPVNIWLVPEYIDLALHRAEVISMNGLHLINLRAPSLSDDQRIIKRIFDLIMGTISLCISAPLMAAIALLIKLDSPGPILFRQKRVGENGKLFEMYKFRTMIQGADELRHTVEQIDTAGNVIYKFPNDPRITRIGKILRRTSLDELPQLFNVLKGEMSLVGPRPELPSLVEKYTLWQRKRFTVPQGMTGWWQVNGRGDRPMHLHTEDDLYYVQNYSLLLDIKIPIKTIPAIISRRGAL
jgi:exopolysaccharide biosynthesis polyprenyl glycosylphosphotransferase